MVLGDAGSASMWGGAALWAAAASAAATAGRMEAIASGCGLGADDCKGPVVICRPTGPTWWCEGEALGCGLHRLALAGLGSCNL